MLDDLNSSEDLEAASVDFGLEPVDHGAEVTPRIVLLVERPLALRVRGPQPAGLADRGFGARGTGLPGGAAMRSPARPSNRSPSDARNPMSLASSWARDRSSAAAMSSICDRPRSRGFFDGSLEELARSQDEHGYDERPAAAEEFVDDVLVNHVLDVVVDMKSD